MPTLDWETFDKNNAPEAITVEASLRIEFCVSVVQEPTRRVEYYPPFQPVHDKSPPPLSHTALI
jgi:hypothetical protein